MFNQFYEPQVKGVLGACGCSLCACARVCMHELMYVCVVCIIYQGALNMFKEPLVTGCVCVCACVRARARVRARAQMCIGWCLR